ncbi:YggT family protein [Microcystis aeruginosa]|jgi:YggT family protein|uniref:YggT family protein n=1 Tax=Microcystis aeruginosa TaxID=1126 RepID=UPI000261FA30|nr:YggT family protein [Microcystis aeruginosa]CCI07639.1 Similar to tr/Q7NFI5/Q7NFI5 [Microcystis aeruginosa PCC 7941]
MSDIGFILTIINNFLQIYLVILIVRVLLTWFQNAGWAYQIMSFLSPITDPYLNLFRSIIPPLGGMDLSPILAFLLLQVVQSVVEGATSLVSSGF